jgi:biotin carboxylase
VLLVVDLRDAWVCRSLPVLEALAEVLDRTSLDRRALARALAERGVAGVTTFADSQVATVAAVAADLGLDGYHSEDAALALTDKTRQRLLLNEAGAGLSVEQEAVPDITAVAAAFAALGPPAVLKPVSATGSRFALLLESAEDVNRARRVLEPLAPTLGGRFTLERYVEGETHPGGDWLADYVSVESSSGSGSTVHFCMSDRPRRAWPLRETGLLLPTLLPPAMHEKIHEVAEVALAALGATTGVTHTEIKLNFPEPAVIEVNGRLGGDVARAARRIGGVDPIREVLRVALGEAPSPPPVLPGFGGTFHPVAPPEATAVVELPTPTRLRRVPGVWAVAPNKRPGDSVSWLEGWNDRLFEALVEAATAAELEATIAELEEIVRTEVRYELDAAPVWDMSPVA